LWGRRGECDQLARLLEDARAGTSGAVVVRGEAGVGKTALLDYLLAHAAGCQIVRAAGVESEMELAFAGLHQLCAPFLDRLERLPHPQHDALGTAFGLRAGAPPDQFLVGLAVLGLLSDVAEAQPLVCLLDDAQWLDFASAQVLGFVARRLAAEGVVIIFAVRDPAEDRHFAGLPQLEVGALPEPDARELLASAIPGRLDESVRDRIVAEARGNPLALLELPRAWTLAAFAGGFGLPDDVSVSGRIEESFRRRLMPLSDHTRLLLLVAAAEPVGDRVLIWGAADRLGIHVEAAGPAIAAGLLDVGGQLRFRHPLVRSVVYRAATHGDRQRVHAALADVTDPELDPDRRAWHLAAAAPGPDESVALELERSAGRAQARGGLAAAAAFLRRSVLLTRDAARRTDRALAGAAASLHAGAFEEALGLLVTAEAGALDEFQRARAELLHGEIALVSSAGGEAPGLLLKAAKRLEPLDLALARETYLDAWGAAMFAGPLARGGNLLDVSRAAEAAPQPGDGSSPSDLLLDGLATVVTRGRAAATPALRDAVNAFSSQDIPAQKGLQWAVLASTASVMLWDFESWDTIITGQADYARAAGAYAALSIALHGQGIVVTWCGNFAAAATPITEAAAVTEATGTRIAPYGAVLLAAFRGREAEAASLIDATIANAIAGGEGLAVQYARWASAVLNNGLGRYEDALVAARPASDDTPELFISAWALPELIEAATRSGNRDLAVTALERLTEATSASTSDWGLGVAARSRALLNEGDVADGLHREAVERLSRTRLRPELGRAHLLYGEWLRREGRRSAARDQLRVAHDLFATIGMEAFAERARRELQATGEIVRKRSVDTLDELTAQELQIARLASDARTNPEIGAQLFLSPRTVEWHLRNVFSKLGVASRKELHAVLPQATGGGSTSVPHGRAPRLRPTDQ
jgi:DNA-binding CsgD family transcriptional regulator